MSKTIQLVYIATVLILAAMTANSQGVETLHNELKQKILADYKSKGTKELFKVYHYLYNKKYNYNSEEGLNKYKTFRAKVKAIDAFNAEEHSYKQGINHLTDMTQAEIQKYYNLKTITVKEERNQMRSLRAVSLDDFNDDEEIRDSVNNNVKGVRTDVDWRKYLPAIRDQGQCGSCWAFATVATIEGNWYSKNKVLDRTLIKDLAPQQLVDCDTATNAGCNGGWYSGAINFIKSGNAPFLEIAYPYKGEQLECKASGTETLQLKIGGYSYTYNPDLNFNSLLLGPVGAAIYSNTEAFSSYASGIFDGPCPAAVDHAVVIVGYDAANSAWIVRNSWGLGWGENGYIRVKENSANANSCMVGRYGYRPTFAA